MKDQATQLRELHKKHLKLVKPGDQAQLAGLTIAITSGKGGVGKTNICLNLGIALAKAGKKVMIIDADLNLGNLDVLLGLSPQFTLRNVIAGQKQLAEILIEGPKGIQILPASSGAPELKHIDSNMRQRVLNAVMELDDQYDFVLIDTPAGIGRHVFDFVSFAQQVLVVTTPEPTAIIDAYAVIKLLWQRNQPSLPIQLVINNVYESQNAGEVFEKLNLVIQRFLNKKIEEWSAIQHDPLVMHAVQEQQPFMVMFPQSEAAQSLYSLRDRLLNRKASPAALSREFVPMY